MEQEVQKIKNCLEQTLNIQKHEKVFILADKGTEKSALLFQEAAQEFSNNIEFEISKKTSHHGAEPTPANTLKIMSSDVSILITTFSLTHTDASRNAAKSGTRIATLPGFTLDMIDALDVDYTQLKQTAKTLADKFSNQLIHIETPSGTDLTLKLGKMHIDDGDITKPGTLMNLPSGEIYTAPSEMNGKLVIDIYEDIVKTPAHLTIKNNSIVEYEEAEKIIKLLEIDPNGKNIAEFGIGLNPKAKIIRKTLQDEKALETCHIAFGNNIGFGGDNNSSIHIDTILLKPTIKIIKNSY